MKRGLQAARLRFIIRWLLPPLWILFVLYPNPLNLAFSLQRLNNPPVMAPVVAGMAGQLEDNSPAEIEQFVYNFIPYHFDWQVYSMPWYFPTLEEALQNQAGDCKARYLLFASLLEELSIPYDKKISLTHIWVDYEGKIETALENEGEVFVVVDESGRTRFSLPRPDLKRSWRGFYQAFWESMPSTRKILLLSGFPFLFGLSALIPVRKTGSAARFSFLASAGVFAGRIKDSFPADKILSPSRRGK